MNNELFSAFEGDLYKKGEYAEPLRKHYNFCFAKIESGLQLRSCLRHGSHTSVGGYPLVLYTNDGNAIAFEALKDMNNLKLEIWNIRSNSSDRIIGCDIYYEGPPMECSVSGIMIESAYGDPCAED